MAFQGNTQAPDQSVTPAKMNAALKAKWVDALRSGDYQQGEMFLRRDGKHCCLGVLCELAGIEISEGGGMVKGPYEKDDYEPIYKVIGSVDAAQELWRMNDGHGRPKRSFSEIADYIEKNL